MSTTARPNQAVLIDLGAIDVEVLSTGLVKVTLDGYVLGFHKGTHPDPDEAIFAALELISAQSKVSLPGLDPSLPVVWFNPFTSTASFGPSTEGLVFTAFSHLPLPSSYLQVEVSETELTLPTGKVLPAVDLHTAAASVSASFS